MKINLTVLTALFAINMAVAGVKPKPVVNDFKKMEGSWHGSLTYLDYSSGKPYTMGADLEIKQLGKSNLFVFSNMYPKEKSANSKDTVTISKDGKYIGKAFIKSRKVLANGSTEIITEETGTDGNDNKPAVFKHTYTFSDTTFSIRKDVQFAGTNEWIKRHEYSYTRNTTGR